jgi:DnaJ-class molecular chaperone
MSEPSTEPDEAQICMPCRGTGRLVSSLGGTPHEVECPWCRGTGKRIPGIDAQEHPAESSSPGPEGT